LYACDRFVIINLTFGNKDPYEVIGIQSKSGGIVTELKNAAIAAPGTILVLPFADGIGDFVNMQPLLNAIARRFPGAAISVAASAYANYLLPIDSKIKVVTPSWFKKEPGPMAQWVRHFIPQRVMAWMAGPVLKHELGGDVDLLINTIYLWECEMDFPHYWTPQTPPRPGAVHTLDSLANVLERELEIEIPHAERYPQLEVRSVARAWAEDYFDRQELGNKPVLALVPDSNMLIKKWPAHHWAWLNDALYERGYQSLIFAPKDCEIAQNIRVRSKQPPLMVSTSLDNVAAVLERCQLAIGVDTGLLHIASAVGTPWLGMFGPTNPEVTGPYDRRIGKTLVAPFVRGESCRQCWKSFKYEDDKCHSLEVGSCIDFLSPRAVLSATLEMLQPLAIS
jgi:ADP-heptose:LPS heptosyltransferase